MPFEKPLRNIHDSWEVVKISTLTGIWKKLIPTLTDDLRGFQDIRGGCNCRCGRNSKRTRIRSGA